MTINTDRNPVFTRGEVAKILNCTTMTIYNREKSKKYRSPQRDSNNYRIYSIADVMRLQLIEFKQIETKPIMSVLWDKGYRDLKQVSRLVDKALTQNSSLSKDKG